MKQLAVVMGVGASRGLGGALARRFAAEGLHTMVTGRTHEKLQRVVDEIHSNGGQAEARVVDATTEEQVKELFASLPASSELRAVLYNVGNNAIIPFKDLSAEQFEKFWRIGCLGGFLAAQAALPGLQRSGGSLLFTGASASLRGRPNFAHFAAAKAGLRVLAQSLAREYGPQGVHVAHVVVDGVIDGDMIREKFGDFINQLGEQGALDVDALADAFWYLHQQHPSAWTHELDLRPFKETW